MKTGMIAVALAAFAALLGTTGTAQAESAPGCSGTVQIGSTAYVDYGGQHIASVKQFKGCGKNWAYVYAWQGFVDSGTGFTLRTAIGAFGSASQQEADRYLGLTIGRHNQRELWSSGTDTLDTCTAAFGAVDIDGVSNTPDNHTSIRC
ncbi:MAG TPA: hypothetical protein VL652_10940 [Kutzneria sp.]|jgi:hypothetical protein|nr:hypothetical protein [Kutzneria sp.]